MAGERPTFDESWYRVGELRPRLRTSVQISRQNFRGEMWHVVHDPSDNQFFRLDEAAYRFVALLDGRRTVEETWKICNDQLGDQAPTQGEAARLLGQLHSANLLYTELPPDAEVLFDRFRKRKVREVQGYLMNVLFPRIPLLDPDRFLDRWVGIFGRLFTWYGLVAWVVLIGAGFWALAGHVEELADRAEGVLDPGNLPLLYAAMVLTKVIHEFGHAFACKRFGRQEGGRGEVHVLGIMLLVFTPMPYVDASSAWSFRSKWRRIIVGAGGMIPELALAAIAAMIWASAAPGTLKALCYNVMFIAGVSTVLFNANPLLRYDGYYILSDLLEIPNLAQGGRNYVYYLVRKYVWGVRGIPNPSNTGGERWWLVTYYLTSTVYRTIICVGILTFVTDKLFILGTILAIISIIGWLVTPVVKLGKYLLNSPELTRTRARALITTAAALAAVLVPVGAISMPDYCRVEGVVEPVRHSIVYGGTDGFIQNVLPTGSVADPNGAVLVQQTNIELENKRAELAAELRRLQTDQHIKQMKEVALAQFVGEQIVAVEEQIRRVDEELAMLRVRAPVAGTWVCPDYRRMPGAYIHRGDPVGQVSSLDDLLIRATAGQTVAAMLFKECSSDAQIRVRGRPDLEFKGKILKIHPAGEDKLPSNALGFAAGGSVQTEQDDRSGTKASEKFFEIEVSPEVVGASNALLPGQRVVLRCRMQDKPLAMQAWQAILQLIQKRFKI